MPTRITLLRHGQTIWNQDGRWQGHAVVPLNDNGRNQAHTAGQYLANVQTDVDVLYSSDLPRASETAEIIASYLNMPVQYDRRLREMDAGQWQGLTVDQIKAWDPEGFEHMMSDPHRNARPDGESYLDQQARAFEAVQDLLAKYPDQHIMVVSHEETIASVLRAAVNMEIPLSCLVPGSYIPNTSLTEIEYDVETKTWNAIVVGATPHLEPQAEGQD